MSHRSGLAKLAILALSLGLAGGLPACNKDKGSTKPAPIVHAPSAVRDLRADSVSSHALLLRWTAPGDDDSTGRAARYDLRYALEAESAVDWWSSALRLSAAPPESAGVGERLWVRGLLADRAYLFALRTVDADSNWSNLSNPLRVSTHALPDTIPPAAVLDLTVEGSGSTTISLSWTAPGNDGRQGTAARYLARFSTAAITEDTWATSGIVEAAPEPGPAGAREHLLVKHLQPATRYYFSLKTQDGAGNLSPLSRSVPGTTGWHATYIVPSRDFQGIAEALAATIPGDSVMLEPGLYSGKVRLPARRTLLSRSGANQTVLAFEGLDDIVVLDQGSLLQGVTVQGGGSVSSNKSGILCAADSVMVLQCRVQECGRGLTLTGSVRAEGCTLSKNGVGIFCSQFAGGIENCTIEENVLGINLRASQASLRNCRIRGNRLGVDSGENTRLAMDDCQVNDNQSLGLTLGSGSARIRATVVSGNGVTAEPSAGPSGGLRSTAGLLALEGCIVANNESVQQGGGIFCSSLDGSMRITLTSIEGNRSLLSGGGVFVDYGTISLTNCLIAGNSASQSGGGLEVTGPVTLQGCSITGNFAGIEGGGIHSQGFAGATSCTLAGNLAGVRGGGILLRGGTAPLDRCILYGNCADTTYSDAHMLEGGVLRLTCSSYDPLAIHLEGSLSRLELSGPQVSGLDPLFTTLMPCASAPTDEGDYSLRSGSPCLSAASPCQRTIGAGETAGARK